VVSHSLCGTTSRTQRVFDDFFAKNTVPSVATLRSAKNFQDATLMTNQPQKHRPALHEYLHQHLHWKSVGLRLLVGLCVLIVVFWFGHHAASEIKVMETWIAGHGALGWFAFVAMVVVFTSMFVPQTMLSIAG
jgi:hypothetical protein